MVVEGEAAGGPRLLLLVRGAVEPKRMRAAACYSRWGGNDIRQGERPPPSGIAPAGPMPAAPATAPAGHAYCAATGSVTP